ncbi:PREDICTED: uncharacterized protein LOC108967549 [Bactrocera latifrons]|nr:PREDICTED: uncharacterized protein LOC108967549 [Bactrocera latifrons]
MSLVGKVVIVTGASSGIGAATAEAFAKEGAKVVLIGRNEANLKATEAACKAVNNKAKLLLIAADVTVDAERIINTTIDHFGQLDVLVNNAGIFEIGNILDVDVDQYDRIFNTNVRSVFLLTKFAAPHLISSKGNIVNVSSVSSLRSNRGMSTYCSAKAALDQLTRCIALDLAPQNVRVNSVNPGVIVTGIHRSLGSSPAELDEFYVRSKEMHPLGRVGEPKEVAHAIIFLASDSTRFITGASMPIDGGRHAFSSF